MIDTKAAKNSVPDYAAFAQKVQQSLSSVKVKVAALRKTDSMLFVTSVVSPALSALIASLAAAAGGNEIFKQAASQAPDGGWKLACVLAAILAFAATVSTLFKKQFGDRLTQGNLCVGRLLALDLDLTTQSRAFEEAAKEYSEIIKTFPEFVS